MCGIVGASSTRNIVPVLIDGIKRLEYRGYDSTGLAVINGTPAQPRLERLVSTARVGRSRAPGRLALAEGVHRHFAHRWATHGRTTPGQRASAHVQLRDRRRPQRHHRELRSAARPAQGRRLRLHAPRPTPSHRHLGALALGMRKGGGDLLRAVRAAVAEFHGAVRDRRDLDRASRPRRRRAGRQSRWSSGIGDGDHFPASDAAALLS
jgi:glucosamine--fructose-6-phosphate aminotransferase (isomerizing)